jgi:hypothetical protein
VTVRSALVALAVMALVAVGLVVDGIVNDQPVSGIGGAAGLLCLLYIAVRTRQRLRRGELKLD